MSRRPYLEALLPSVKKIAIAGGRAALEHYGSRESESKEDGSPLTLADRAAHRTIVAGLRGLEPALPVLSEESPPAELAGRRGWARFWLVDPLDGTKEFLKQTGEFAVNNALVEEHEPVLGVLHVPVSGTTYSAAKGSGAFRETASEAPLPIRTRASRDDDLVVLVSKDHAGPEVDALLAKLPRAKRASAGSALKLALVAEGRADLYPRTGRTMEWDTAAGQCLVEAAGGRVTDFSGRPLSYNKETLENPWFLVSGDATVDWPGRLALVP
ncbi:3'(2'),5'-bisphosphate nucleotidase CysQ [bacterium]|nr:3'(2'),5'-bisphosphate nucleotidase CysQ [bacterium]